MDSPQSDHTQWFAEEVQPHESVLRSYLHGSFPGVRDIDDVVQESYLRIWKARATQPVHSAKAFLLTIARNLALDLVRRERRSPIQTVSDLTTVDVVEDRPGAVETIVTGEKVRLLATALATLPPRCRDVVMLCKIDGRTHREAATELGIAEKTVDEHLLRGLKRLGVTLRELGLKQHFEP